MSVIKVLWALIKSTKESDIISNAYFGELFKNYINISKLFSFAQ